MAKDDIDKLKDRVKELEKWIEAEDKNRKAILKELDGMMYTGGGKRNGRRESRDQRREDKEDRRVVR